MKVVTLQQFGEGRFLKELQQFSEQHFSGDTRNNSWFTRLPEIYKTRYKEWFFLVSDDDVLIAFSTIQEFYPQCYRMLTRTYYNPVYRRRHLAYEHTRPTPAMYMLDKQLEYIQDYKTLFISTQMLNRRNVLTRLKNKIGNEWNMHTNMVQTCNEVTDKNCWQNVIYTGDDIKLPNIPISEWKLL